MKTSVIVCVITTTAELDYKSLQDIVGKRGGLEKDQLIHAMTHISGFTYLFHEHLLKTY